MKLYLQLSVERTGVTQSTTELICADKLYTNVFKWTVTCGEFRLCNRDKPQFKFTARLQVENWTKTWLVLSQHRCIAVFHRFHCEPMFSACSPTQLYNCAPHLYFFWKRRAIMGGSHPRGLASCYAQTHLCFLGHFMSSIRAATWICNTWHITSAFFQTAPSVEKHCPMILNMSFIFYLILRNSKAELESNPQVKVQQSVCIFTFSCPVGL